MPRTFGWVEANRMTAVEESTGHRVDLQDPRISYLSTQEGAESFPFSLSPPPTASEPARTQYAPAIICVAPGRGNAARDMANKPNIGVCTRRQPLGTAGGRPDPVVYPSRVREGLPCRSKMSSS